MTAAIAQAPHALRLPLRPYQQEALQAILDARAHGVTRPLVVLPVGAGKTVVFAHLLRQRAGRALVLAHRDELLQQAVAKLRLVDPTAQIGMVKADDNAVDAPVVVASVQTLSRRPRLAQLRPGFATIVVDEAHHATAPTYRRILRHCGAFAAAGPLTLGVTATPERSDTAQLRDIWQAIVYEQSLLALITAGYLANLRAVQVLLQVNFDALHTRQGDFVDAEVDTLLLQADAPQHVVQAYQAHAAGRKALVFTPTVRTAYAMADAFRAAGLAAEALDGTTPAAARQATLERLRTGATQVLANCALLTEGFDEPSIAAIVMARPTLSKPLYIQMLGRGTRLYPGKTDCLILDVVGASTRHALLTTAALFDVDPATLAQRALTAAVAARPRPAPDTLPAEPPQGTLVAASVELFRARPLHWVQTQRGAWVLSIGQGTLRLLPDAAGTWTVVHVPRGERPRPVGQGLPLDYALGVAEDYARRQQAGVLVDPSAAWRQQPPTEKQLALLRKWRVALPPDLTRGAAADLLTAIMGDWD
jgi:superfamily II DNA or RNA helicase